MEGTEKILEAVKDYMEKNEISYDFDSENEYFYTTFSIAEDSEDALEFGLAVLENGAVSYCLLPQDVPFEMRDRVAEYLHRANFGLLHGNFELDYEQGRVQYKTFVLSSENSISQDQVDSLFSAPFAVVGKYMPGLENVLKNSKKTVEKIFQEVE